MKRKKVSNHAQMSNYTIQMRAEQAWTPENRVENEL